MPRLAPGLVAPYHMGPIVDVLQTSEREKVRAVIAAPPQHGKSQLIKTGLVRRLMRDTPRNSAYCTYNTDRAEEVSQEAQWMADEAGLEWEGNRRKWGVPKGSSLLWTGIGGGLTGHKVDDILVVDDPIKDRTEANSKTYRDRAFNWLTAVAFTRLHPGASALVVATRWHEDDVSGRLIKAGWDYVNLPAISDDGEALWPSHRPLDFLADQRREIGEYDWASLYQGAPRPKGGAVFGDPSYYRKPPEDGYQLAHGVDLAYSSRTSADYSVCVTLARVGSIYYVLNVQRRQCDAPAFCGLLSAVAASYPPARMVWHAAGTEKGSAQFIQSQVPHFTVMPANTDKFQRATPVASAWNDGRVLVPESQPWVSEFVEEVCAFTGVNDAHDDQVDALASAFSALQLRRRDLDVSALPAF